MMPQSLTISTPPSHPAKRQRSQDSRERQSRPDSAGQCEPPPARRDNAQTARTTVKIPSYLNKTKTEIAQTFQDLEWRQRMRLQSGLNNPKSPYRLDRTSPIVTHRNRYLNVQPWDAYRVKLKTPINGSDYVNASPIVLKSQAATYGFGRQRTSGSLDDTPAAVSEIRYIATQGPKEGQFLHFWRMVTQETSGEVGVVIMLTACYEGNRVKCAQYFPLDMENPVLLLDTPNDEPVQVDEAPADDESETNEMNTNISSDGTSQPGHEAGSVTLLSISTESSIGCEVRRLKVVVDNTSKEIYHYLFNGWPDFGKPEAEDRQALLELTRVSKIRANGSPRVVHCSAGVGRTGTFVGVDYLLRELEEGRLVDSSYLTAKVEPDDNNVTETWGKSGPAKVSTPEAHDENDLIAETINTLREQRMMMVMNELQFSFLYEVIREAFMDKYAEKETGPVVIEPAPKLEERSPKLARKDQPFGGLYQGTRVGQLHGEEDTVSEAETEIMDHDKKGEPNIEADDPYAAVAPEGIQEGTRKDTQDEVRDHEVK